MQHSNSMELRLKLLLLFGIFSSADALFPIKITEVQPDQILLAMQDILGMNSGHGNQNQRIKRSLSVNDIDVALPIGIKAGVKFQNKLRPFEGSTAFLSLDNTKKTLPISKNIKTAKFDFSSNFSQSSHFNFYIGVEASYHGTYYGFKNNLKAYLSIEMEKDERKNTHIRITSENLMPKFKGVNFDNIDIAFSTDIIRCGLVYTLLKRFEIEIEIEFLTKAKLTLFSASNAKLFELRYNTTERCAMDLQSSYSSEELALNLEWTVSKGKDIGLKVEGNYNKDSITGRLLELKLPTTTKTILLDNLLELNNQPVFEMSGEWKDEVGYRNISKIFYQVYGGTLARGEFIFHIDYSFTNLKFEEKKWGFKPNVDFFFYLRNSYEKIIESRKGDLVLWRYKFNINHQHLFEILSPSAALSKSFNGGMKNIHKDVRKFSKLWFKNKREISIEPGKVEYKNDAGGHLLLEKTHNYNGTLYVEIWRMKFGDQVMEFRNLPYSVMEFRNLPYSRNFMCTLDGETLLNMMFAKNTNGMVGKLEYKPNRNDSLGITLLHSSPSSNRNQIQILSQKDGQEVSNYRLQSNLVSGQDQSTLTFQDKLIFHDRNFLEKNVLTVETDSDSSRFQEQESQLGIRIGNNSDSVMAKGFIKKDKVDLMKFLLNTNRDPLQFRSSYKGVANNLKTVGIKITHRKDQYFEISYDSPYFKSLRINRVGYGNEREVLINGRRVFSFKMDDRDKLEMPVEEMIAEAWKFVGEKVSSSIQKVLNYKRGYPAYAAYIWLAMTAELNILSVGWFLETHVDDIARLFFPLYPLFVLSDIQT